MESDSARIVGAGIFRHRCGDQSGGRADCGQSLDGVSQTPHYSESDRRDESDCGGIARTRHRVLYINQRVGYRLLWAEQGHFNYETVGAGDGFLADLCVKWEGEARRAEDFGVRVVRLRDGSRERWRCVGQDGLAISPVSRWTDHAGYSMGSHGSIARTSSAWCNGHLAI